MIDARIDQAKTVLSNLDRNSYHVGNARWQQVVDTRAVFTPLFQNAPNGVMGLTAKFLTDPEATYLVVNLCGGAHRDMHRGVVTLTKVGFRQVDGVTQAVNLETGDLLGAMNRLAVTPTRAWHNNDWYSPNPLKDAAYTGLTFGSPYPGETLSRDTFVLPLTGPALRHPTFQRMADFAQAILAGDVPELQTLTCLDVDNQDIEVGREEQQAIVRAVIDEALAQYVPAEWDAELVSLMSSMDWTFDYADRPNSACYDQRNQIERRLKALPLEVAIAFLDVAGVYWDYAYRLLRDHPDAIKLAA